MLALSIGKVDAHGAFFQLCVRNPSLNMFVVWDPVRQRWAVLRSAVLSLGNGHSCMDWCAFAFVWERLLCDIGIPVSFYVDDGIVFLPAGLERLFIDTVETVASWLGITLSTKPSAKSYGGLGNEVEILGLSYTVSGDMSSPALRVMMTRSMREVILREFDVVISRLSSTDWGGGITVKVLQRICGLVNFVLTHSEYKMNLAQVVFLLRLASDHTNHSLRSSIQEDPGLRHQVKRALQDLADFVLRDDVVAYIDRERLERGRITVYTDAALSGGGPGGPTLGLGGVIVTPEGQLATFSFVDTDPIYDGRSIMVYELLAVELAIELWGDLLRDKWALFKVDNMGAVYALTKWTTNCRVCMELVARIQRRLRALETLP